MADLQKKTNFQVNPSAALKGDIRVPGDKSISHRALMLCSIAEGVSKITGLLMGQDNLATLAALQNLGVAIDFSEAQECQIQGVGLHGLQAPQQALDLQNSGTAMRLFAGLLAGQAFNSKLIGDASLQKRPMLRVVQPLNSMGAKITTTSQGTAPLEITGGQSLQGIHYTMPIASAQIKSSLLLAAIYAKGETIIEEPIATRDHTELMLQLFDYPLQIQNRCIRIQGFQPLKPVQLKIPGDISSAAFFIVAASIVPGSEITLRDVGVNPRRLGIIHLLREMGADIQLINLRNFGNEAVADIQVRSASLRGIEIPINLVPSAIDEFPILFIAAACAKGRTILRGAAELRVKESDRIAVMSEGLNQLGIQTEILADGLIIEGGIIQGGNVDSHQDHRVAMSFAVAACVAKSAINIAQCSFVETSFPGFVELANYLGFKIQYA
jgi:3-phosphoshikimate 1-carboxyvinyltransferase